MKETKTFPCIACGAPIEPEVGKTHIPCPYCGSNLAIPKELQLDAIPLGSNFKIPEPKPTPEMEAAEFLRKAQPVTIKAFNLFAIWTWIRRFLPGCLITIAIAICLCGGSILFITLQQGR